MSHPILNGLLQQPVLLILLGAFTVLMALIIPAYFYAYRPRANSTEWIARLDRRSFRPLTETALVPADIVWSLIAMICSAFLWIVYYVIWMGLLSVEHPATIIKVLLKVSVPVAVTSLSVYLILRLMGGKPLPAILAAIIGAISHSTYPKALAMFSLALLFLYLWVCAPYNAPLFFRALWLLFSTGAYGLAVLFYFPMIWSAPFFVGTYITMQVIRWKRGNPETRGKKLAGSIALVLLMFVLGFLAVCLAYCVRRGKGDPITLLRSFSFYRRLFPALLSRLSGLFKRTSYWNTLLFSDAFCFITGVIALVPLLHGLIKRRDTRCLFLILLLPCLILGWYFSACYAMVPVFALIIGWCWCHYAQRGRPLYAVGFTATYALFLYAELFIH